ncbi:HAMP domain-containing sensor histidine kinase [Prochlorococcus sp. MIT 1307]|uniref:sensor histidine kinase n=1 Tax=Prochlorococcus sp. MIT 1307 TaxID=3096219 RepID=UPI002A74CF2D|nr:HAMP domain-containing sensor histidine kinase [Prochlorococcus sp. MIT 1307]
MQLSERFLNLVQQQLKSFDSEVGVQRLVVYVAQSKDGQSPSLEAVGQWPSLGRALPPVEDDPGLRAPSPDRRWYPLQEGSILLGVLRAECIGGDQAWSEKLDQRLQATAAALAQCLGLELDRRRLLDELTQQREQIGLMVHQLRNPLAALRTYAQLLLRKLGPDSNHRVLVEGLLSEQDQLNRYVSALDELSQSKLLSFDGPPTSLLLPPVFAGGPSLDVQSLLKPLIERAAATAHLQGRKWFGPREWPVWTNRPRPSGDGVIAEIVANLLENAFRYSSSTIPIGLFINESGLCVWDRGTPIAIDERERIFQKGVRGKDTNDCSGSGLGLALGLQLSEQIGGELKLIIPPSEVDSTLPKEGNAFYLTLPKETMPEIEA